MAEAFEKWAERKAPTLDEDGWLAREPWARWSFSGNDELSRHRDEECRKARALFAYRDRIIGELTADQRAGILGRIDLSGVGGFEWMNRAGIVDEFCGLTDFGRHIASVLRAAEGE